MRHGSLIALGVAAVVASLLLTGCGGSSKSTDGTPTTTGATTGSSSGKTAVTEQACDTLSGIIEDLQFFEAANNGFDYPKDAADMANFADTHQVSGEVADSVKKLRGFLEDFAAAAKDVGLAPNDDPLPDQLDKLKSKLHLPDKGLARALQTLLVWTGNSCH
jgi:hypothetical protein